MVESFVEERLYNKIDTVRSINGGCSLIVSFILINISVIGLVGLHEPDDVTGEEEELTLCGQDNPCGGRITSGTFLLILCILFPGLFMLVFFAERDGAIDEL